MPKGGWRGGGRPKGSPNKTTSEQRSYINNILNEEWPLVSEVLKKLRSKNPDAYMRHVISLAEFSLPKMQRTEITGEDGNNLTIEIKRTVVEHKT